MKLKKCECAANGWNGCGFCTRPSVVEVRDGDVWADDEGRSIKIDNVSCSGSSANTAHVIVTDRTGRHEFAGWWMKVSFGYPWYRLVSRDGRAVAA